VELNGSEDSQSANERPIRRRADWSRGIDQHGQSFPAEATPIINNEWWADVGQRVGSGLAQESLLPCSSA
jgi:hypothetical protein